VSWLILGGSAVGRASLRAAAGYEPLCSWSSLSNQLQLNSVGRSGPTLVPVIVMRGPPLLSFTTSPIWNGMKSLHPHRVGARVRLNSGGPEMLIVDLVGSTAVVASWCDRNGRVHERTYPNQCVHGNGTPVIQSST
jgi:uncharacterized protein YodC (DUF2158 family)